MKRINILLIIFISLVGCGGEPATEWPLILPTGAEPSAKMYNDLGMEEFKSGDYADAYLRFRQAYAADKREGEIHFNLALTLYYDGKRDKALKYFKLAREYADGNKKILESEILNFMLEKKLSQK